jgi:hypothetical protein
VIAAPSRRWAARVPATSAAFLVARGRRAGSSASTTVPPLSATSWRSRSAASAGSSAIARAGPGERHEIASLQRGRRPQIGELGQVGLRLDRQLALVEEHHVRSVRRQDGEAERQRRVRYVGAADVEQSRRARTGRSARHGWRRRLSIVGRKPRDLVLGQFAGEGLDGLDLDAAERRTGLIGPDSVDGVSLDGDQCRAALLDGRCAAPWPRPSCAARDRSRALPPWAWLLLQPFRWRVGRSGFRW